VAEAIPEAIPEAIEQIYKSDSHRVLATLMRIIGDLELAEEALQEAFSAALKQWPVQGLPQNPYAWLVSAAKFKAFDARRRSSRERELLSERVQIGGACEPADAYLVEDDRLRLIFYCSHPALPMDSRVALALREVCGLSTEEIARLYLLPGETVKKRISRAKTQIKEKNISFEIPAEADLIERVESVLKVIYLIFTEGYSPGSGENHLRRELTAEAIFLGRNLAELLPTPETLGLLALLLIQESRGEARVSKNGDLIPLEKQDRSLWNRALIAEGLELLHRAILSGRLGPYGLQAAIASVHAAADSVQATEWNLIAGYYDMLLSIQPSPVIEFNRAIAVGMHEGPRAGLALIDRIVESQKLSEYPFLYAAQAEFSRKLGLKDKAIQAYNRAIELTRQSPQKRYLSAQLAEIFP
jgi:RNA polymerase sigma-70 factor, ECF subfamily